MTSNLCFQTRSFFWCVKILPTKPEKKKSEIHPNTFPQPGVLFASKLDTHWWPRMFFNQQIRHGNLMILLPRTYVIFSIFAPEKLNCLAKSYIYINTQ